MKRLFKVWMAMICSIVLLRAFARAMERMIAPSFIPEPPVFNWGKSMGDTMADILEGRNHG